MWGIEADTSIAIIFAIHRLRKQFTHYSSVILVKSTMIKFEFINFRAEDHNWENADTILRQLL